MTGGALNFTLGLQANQFLNTMGIASGKLVAFLGVGQLVTKAFRSMWDAIQQGGKLTDLAAAASISVKELYQLQFAFEQIGASADGVNSVILRMRANLAQGNQDDVLKSLGLNPEQLRNMGVTDQFERIAASLGRLNATARAGAAQSIFGREGANVAQMIANSGTAFADAMAAAAEDATVWDQVSNTFDMIADKVTALQRHIETVWAQLAGALIQAFNEGRLTELLTDIVVTGFQAGLAVVPAMFAKLGEVLIRTFEVPLLYLQAGIEYAIDQAVNNPTVRRILQLNPNANVALLGLDALGITSGKPSSFEEIMAARLEEGLKFNFGTGEFGVGDISDAANDYLLQSFGKAGDIIGGLSDRLNEFVARLPQAGAISAGSSGVEFKASKEKTTDVTSLEKMGGVLLGLGRGFGGDEARQTANNTSKLVALATETNALLKGQAGEDYANI